MLFTVFLACVDGGGRAGEAGREHYPLGFSFRWGSSGIFFVVYNLTGIWISGRNSICLPCFPQRGAASEARCVAAGVRDDFPKTSLHMTLKSSCKLCLNESSWYNFSSRAPQHY